MPSAHPLRRSILAAALALPLAALAYPDKPIEWVVPYPAGGGSDVVARTLAEPMGKALGQTLIINNKPGAGTNIGADYAAKAKADGYVMLTADTATLAANPSLYPKLSYNVEKDFAPVGLMARFPMLLVVNASVPAKNLAEFVAWVKQQPGGVNYATGQVFDIARHTERAHVAGAIAIWDLAHATGNIPLALHDGNVDAAAWCTYKYLNSGPGALAQLFVHARHASDPATPRLAGWWGNDPASRFLMAETFVPGRGADGFRVSTPPILSLAPIAVSLAMFDEVGMAALRERSLTLTGELARLIDGFVPDATVITPRDPAERGSQLSIRVGDAHARLRALEAFDVVADAREPDLIRLAPVPMYCSFEDVVRAADALARTA